LEETMTIRYGQDLDYDDYPVGSCYPKKDGRFVQYSDYQKLVTALRDAVLDLDHGHVHVHAAKRGMEKALVTAGEEI
jgi:hypothetical protein